MAEGSGEYGSVAHQRTVGDLTLYSQGETFRVATLKNGRRRTRSCCRRFASRFL